MLIMQINVNELTHARTVELVLLIETFKLDLICVNETFLKPNKNFTIPGYKIYRFDRPGPKGGGGVMVLVKDSIESEDLGSASIDYAEIQLVKVKLNDNKLLKIASVYCPPGIVLSDNAIKYINPQSHGLIICGDLNAKNPELGCTGIPNHAGTKIVELLRRTNLKQLSNGHHTFTTWKGRPEVLDLVIASEDVAKLVTGIEALPDIGSDHLPVAIQLRGHGKRTKSWPEIRLNLNATNWEAFATAISSQCHAWDTTDLVSTAKLDEAADTIERVFANANLIIPRKEASNLKAWRPSKEILTAIKARRSARRLFERLQTSFAKTCYNQASTRVKQLIKLAKLGRFKHRCDQLSKLLKDKPRLFWKEFKTLSSNNTSSDRRNYPPILKADGLRSYTDLDKAETFAKHLHDNVWVNDDDPNFCKGNEERVNRSVKHNKESLSIAKEPRNDPSGIWSVTTGELIKIVKNLKTTAPGEDGISNALLKKAPNIFWEKITDVCNASLKLGYIPTKWKQAVVVMIAKEGKDWTTVKGYRPISLLSAIAKILERIVSRRLVTELRRRKILPPTQSAFLSDHGVEDHPYRVSQKGINGLIKRETTIMSCLDVEGAFDKIWHDGLRFKTIDHGLPAHPTRWISNFLDSRTFCVRIGSEHSQKYPIRGGVPQGSPLSPMLYLLFTADLPRIIPRHTDKGIFADDLALITSHRDEELAIARMNESLTYVKEWFDKWRLKLNAPKSQVIRFSNKRKAPPRPVILGPDILEYHKHVKYLGVIYDERLLFKHHFNAVLGRAERRLTALKSLCKRRFGIPPDIAVSVYKAYIRPILSFGCPAWVGTHQAMFEKIEIYQNKALRIAYRLPPWSNVEETRQLAGVEPLEDFIFQTATNWLSRSIKAGNLAGQEAKDAMANLENAVYQHGKRTPLVAMIRFLHLKFDR